MIVVECILQNIDSIINRGFVRGVREGSRVVQGGEVGIWDALYDALCDSVGYAAVEFLSRAAGKKNL